MNRKISIAMALLFLISGFLGWCYYFSSTSATTTSTNPLILPASPTPLPPLSHTNPKKSPPQINPFQHNSPELVLRSNGRMNSHVIALDELYLKHESGKEEIRSIPPQKNIADLQQFAQQIQQTENVPTNLLVYLKDKPRKESTRSVLTNQVLVKMSSLNKLLSYNEALTIETPEFAPEYRIVSLDFQSDVLLAASDLSQLKGVLEAEPLLATWKSKKALPNDSLINQQWHLKNTGQSGGLIGTDAKVENVWGTFGGSGFRGAGISIAIIDDGLQTNHPDLSLNVNTAIDFDWNDNTPADPNPVSEDDNHGTACAGVAAAVGNNSLGVSGAAPEATLVGFRLIAAAFTDAQEADAFTKSNSIIQIKSNSWGDVDDAASFGGPGPLALAALESATSTGRSGKGTIFTFAGGNGRDKGDYSNFDGYCSNRFVIGVAAVNNLGKQAWYSESGSNLLITAPSSGGTLGITTTDRTSTAGYNVTSGIAGNYHPDFSGTSSATPLVSGVCALILQKNPNLGWRDVKEILVRSAFKVDPTDSDWIANDAGFNFNHKFGAGMIQAEPAVALAENWVNLPVESTTQLTNNTVQAIPDNNAAGVSRSFNFNATTLRVEHVEVTLTVTHPFRGDLECILTSPTGKQSVLMIRRGSDTESVTNETYTLTTVHHWGEKSNGTWTVKVADLGLDDIGTLRSVTVKLLGTNHPTGLENWRFTSFTAAELSNRTLSGNNADPDADGYTNLQEYALGTQPKVSTSKPAIPVNISGANLTLTYAKLRTDVTYTVETSTTLAAGSWTTTGVNQGSGTNPIAFVAMGSDSKKFLRLRILNP